MRKVTVKMLEPGMIIAKTVLAPNGQVLLPAGAELNPSYITRLQTMGFPAVMIKESYTEGFEFPELVSDRTRVDGLLVMKEAFTEAQKFKKINTKKIKDLVNRLVDEGQRNRKQLYEVPDIRFLENYIYGHSVNVCVLALRIGFLLHYNELQLRDLGLGAILHDIGSVLTEKQVTSKPDQLTPAEMKEVQLHPVLGFKLLREHRDINLLSAHVALQHHERMDGRGYPRGLKGNDITEFARIVAMADLFDALTSERAHRKAYSFPDAVEIFKKETGQKVDANLSELFLRNIAVFATGRLVELSSGEIGLVVKNNPSFLNHPVVRIVKGKNASEITANGPEVDLSERQDWQAVALVKDESCFFKELRATAAASLSPA